VKPEDVDGQPTGSDASVKKLKKDNPWMQREAAAAVQKQQQQPMPPQQKHTPQVVSLSKKDNQWAQRDKVETAAGPEDVNGKHGNQTTPAHEQQQPHQQSDAVRPVARLHIDAVVHAAEKVADAPAETSAIPRRGTATSAETDVASSQQGHDLHSATAQSTIDALKRKVESLQFELKQAQDQLVHVRADRDSLQMQVDELRSRPTAAAVEDSASAAKQYMQLSHGAAREAERVQKELARQVEELSFKLKQESERSEQLTRERGELQGSFDAQLEATKLADATAQVARAKVESLEADVRQAETSRLEQMAACRVAQDESHAAQQALAGANRAQQHRMSSVENALATEKELRALAERSAVGIRKQSTDFIESFTREWRRRLAEEHARGKAAIVTAVKAERSAAAVSAQRLESCESLLQSEVAARTAAEQQLEVVQEQLGGLVASAAVLESNANEHVERRVAAALAQRKQDDAAALENMAQRCSVAEAQAIELESRLELETEARSEMASSTSATTAALTASVQQLTNAASSLQRVRMEREQLVQQVHELQEKLASFAKQDEQEQMAVAAAALHPIGSGEDVLHSNIDTRLRVNFNPLLMDHDELFQVR
jgi:chromosome segregation ATPase